MFSSQQDESKQTTRIHHQHNLRFWWLLVGCTPKSTSIFLLTVVDDTVDPGNYATDIAAGASYRFRLLFIVLLSNLFAIFLQSLCIKLGTVTGLNLAEACRAFLPRWLNYVLYAMAEIAIIATDISEVREYCSGVFHILQYAWVL